MADSARLLNHELFILKALQLAYHAEQIDFHRYDVAYEATRARIRALEYIRFVTRKPAGQGGTAGSGPGGIGPAAGTPVPADGSAPCETGAP